MYVEPVKENMTMVAIWGREAGVEFVINNRAWHDYPIINLLVIELSLSAVLAAEEISVPGTKYELLC